MALEVKSKREHCPACDSVSMNNIVLMRPGSDVEIFVECADCGSFVARYTLKAYTCDDPYRSFLRQMRQRRMASGSAAHGEAAGFRSRLEADYRLAKEITSEKEETRDLEELIAGLEDIVD